MRIIHPRDFIGDRAWAALPVAEFDGVGVRLHWADQSYIWHRNDGQEVFVVLDGEVDMKTRQDGVETVHRLRPGDIFHATEGDEHVAVPRGAARVLVIERTGSV